MFRTVPLSIIRSSSLYTQSNIYRNWVPSWSSSQAVWHTEFLCVQWKTPDDGQRNCLKHVEFYSKNKFEKFVHLLGRSQRPRGLRRVSTAARLLRLWVRIPPGAWRFVCVECCVLSGSGLCDGLITRPEKSYRLWCVVVRDLETSRMRRPWPALGCSATGGGGGRASSWFYCKNKKNRRSYTLNLLKRVAVIPPLTDPLTVFRKKRDWLWQFHSNELVAVEGIF